MVLLAENQKKMSHTYHFCEIRVTLCKSMELKKPKFNKVKELKGNKEVATCHLQLKQKSIIKFRK